MRSQQRRAHGSGGSKAMVETMKCGVVGSAAGERWPRRRDFDELGWYRFRTGLWTLFRVNNVVQMAEKNRKG